MQVQHSIDTLHYRFSRKYKYKTSKMFPVESSLNPTPSALKSEECFKPEYSQFSYTDEVAESLRKTAFIPLISLLL